MRVGTPGFSGQRLREAREARGLSAISLSELAGVSVQAVYHYESDRMSPSPDVLERLADAVKMPVTFLLLPDRGETGVSPEFFRSMSAATKGARNRARHRLRWLQDIVSYVSDFVALPEPNFPDLALPDDPILLSDSEIEQAAEDLRRYWRMGDGPIANMILLLENQGAIVGRDFLGADTLDGVSQVDAQGRPNVMIGIDKGSPARWRFDAAHELAHNLLHAKVARESLERPEVHKKIERQAHHFARAFLLPLGPFGDDLFGVSLDAFRAIKPKWNVSIAMMIFRAHDAGLMSEETERKLRIGISRNKWRTIEPYDQTTEAEEPRVLRRSFELILDARDQTPADITGRIGLPPADVEALSGLPGGYLTDFSRVTLLPSREPTAIEASDKTAEVIDLTARHRSAR
jgi:Zn-dependent peptidase ImmA (M78 family)/DNA-binding XRE family transcriptional regulator